MERLTIGAVANLTGVPTHTLKVGEQAFYRYTKQKRIRKTLLHE